MHYFKATSQAVGRIDAMKSVLVIFLLLARCRYCNLYILAKNMLKWVSTIAL